MPTNASITDWYEAGQRDWDLCLITATHSDDDPACEIARDERDELRAHISDLGQDDLRDYLLGLQHQMEMTLWLSL